MPPQLPSTAGAVRSSLPHGGEKEKETVKEVTHEWELVNKQKPIWMRDNTRRFFVILHWWLFHRRQGRQR